MEKSIKEAALELREYAVGLRRHFHMHPEPAMQEFNTAQRIKEELEEIGIPYETVAGTGILATIQCGEPGRVIALRADTDALELDDAKDVSYKSKIPGMCHACGHDGHTSMLLTAAKILNARKKDMKGTIKLIFQPAEESVIGARLMIEENNFMDDVDGVFGIHLIITESVGKLLYCEGPFAASGDGFKIKVKGLGGHGAMPHTAIDPVLVASAIVVNAQSIVSREIPPLEPGVITFGVIKGGSRYNIIADEVFLEGTIRSYNTEVRETLCASLERMTKEVANSYRAKAEVTFISSVPPLINDAEHTRFYVKTAEKLVGKENIIKMAPITGSDDFAVFLSKAPGVFACVGCRNEEKGIVNFHHHPAFDIDEDSLPIGSALYAQYAYDFLNE